MIRLNLHVETAEGHRPRRPAQPSAPTVRASKPRRPVRTQRGPGRPQAGPLGLAQSLGRACPGPPVTGPASESSHPTAARRRNTDSTKQHCGSLAGSVCQGICSTFPLCLAIRQAASGPGPPSRGLPPPPLHPASELTAAAAACGGSVGRRPRARQREALRQQRSPRRMRKERSPMMRVLPDNAGAA